MTGNHKKDEIKMTRTVSARAVALQVTWGEILKRNEIAYARTGQNRTICCSKRSGNIINEFYLNINSYSSSIAALIRFVTQKYIFN